MARWTIQGPRYTKRIMRDGEAMAAALQFRNGLWGLYDTEETRPLRHQRWQSARDVLAFVRNNPDVTNA